MRLSWRRGLFRSFLVVAVAWVGYAEFHEYCHQIFEFRFENRVEPQPKMTAGRALQNGRMVSLSMCLISSRRRTLSATSN